MLNYSHEIEKEIDSIQKFILEKYGVNIKTKEQYIEFVLESSSLLIALKTWNKNLKDVFKNVEGVDNYFKEMISNTINMTILGTLDLKVPSLVMLRRTQECILSYLYYFEHPVEYYKKESDDNIRILSGFTELKEYIKKYPFSIKYNISESHVQDIVQVIINDWGLQYKELSNYVHGTNSKYFQMVEYFNEFTFSKTDIKFLTKQVKKTSSIINSLLICFYFDRYIKFDEYLEKSLIRNCISNDTQYKAKIVKIFNEI